MNWLGIFSIAVRRSPHSLCCYCSCESFSFVTSKINCYAPNVTRAGECNGIGGQPGIIADVSSSSPKIPAGTQNLLLIDTCGDTGSVAIVRVDTESHSAATAVLPGRTASERLISTIRELAAERNMPLHAFDAIGVVNGPGSFTGVRVGVSAAKGLSEALSVPLIAISRLAVLVHGADAGPAGQVQAILDAGRGEFYAGVYSAGQCVREALVSREELLAPGLTDAGLRTTTVVCEPAVADSLRELSPEIVKAPTAESALPLVLKALQERRFADVATLDANYVRRTDAEIFAKQAAQTSSRVAVGR